MSIPMAKKYIHDFLDEEKFGVLSTVSERGRVDAAPIYFIVEDLAFGILFCTPSKTQKFRNFQKRKDVVLTVTNQEHSETVQVRGVVEVIGTIDEKPDYLERLAAKLNNHMNFITILPLLAYHGQQKMVIRIRPKEVRMRRYDGSGVLEKILKF